MAEDNTGAVEECCALLGLETAADKQLIALALKVCLADISVLARLFAL